MLAGIGALFLSYGIWVVSGADEPITKPVIPGVTYERFRVGDAVAHLVTIDLDRGCTSIATSAVASDGTVDASKTVTWAETHGLSVAINGGFFFPYDQSTAWDVYPAAGEPVTVLGPVIRPIGGVLDLCTAGSQDQPARGQEVRAQRSQAATPWDGRSFWIDHEGRGAIGALPDRASLAVTGRHQILEGGVVTAPASEPYPRTIVSVDSSGRRLWWLVVDGKQPGYSNGLTLADAAGLLAARGAASALELDGGGSSTLVIDEGAGPEVANRPMEVRVPGRSRVVANHLGIAAAPAEACGGDVGSAEGG